MPIVQWKRAAYLSKSSKAVLVVVVQGFDVVIWRWEGAYKHRWRGGRSAVQKIDSQQLHRNVN